MADDRRTLAKGSTPAREISPLGGKGMDRLTLAFPYPSSPALGRKDTTYAWSYRRRCKHTRVMMRVRMLMVGNDVHEADIQRMMTLVLKLKMMIKKIMLVRKVMKIRMRLMMISLSKGRSADAVGYVNGTDTHRKSAGRRHLWHERCDRPRAARQTDIPNFQSSAKRSSASSWPYTRGPAARRARGAPHVKGLGLRVQQNIHTHNRNLKTTDL